MAKFPLLCASLFLVLSEIYGREITKERRSIREDNAEHKQTNNILDDLVSAELVEAELIHLLRRQEGNDIMSEDLTPTAELEIVGVTPIGEQATTSGGLAEEHSTMAPSEVGQGTTEIPETQTTPKSPTTKEPDQPLVETILAPSEGGGGGVTQRQAGGGVILEEEGGTEVDEGEMRFGCYANVMMKYYAGKSFSEQMAARRKTSVTGICDELKSLGQCLHQRSNTYEMTDHVMDEMWGEVYDISALGSYRQMCEKSFDSFSKNKACIFNEKVASRLKWCKDFLHAECSADRMYECAKPALELQTSDCPPSSASYLMSTFVQESQSDICKNRDPRLDCLGRQNQCHHQHQPYNTADVYGQTYNRSERIRLTKDRPYQLICQDLRKLLDCLNSLHGTVCPPNQLEERGSEAYYQAKCIKNFAEEEKYRYCSHNEAFSKEKIKCLMEYYSTPWCKEGNPDQLISCYVAAAEQYYINEPECVGAIEKSTTLLYSSAAYLQMECSMYS